RGLRAQSGRGRRAAPAVQGEVAESPLMETASGGGPLAAVVTASAAALLAKVARASKEGWADAAGVAAQAESLHDRAAPLADLTARAYEEAIGASGGDYEVGRAYTKAAEPPLRIVEAAAD